MKKAAENILYNSIITHIEALINAKRAFNEDGISAKEKRSILKGFLDSFSVEDHEKSDLPWRLQQYFSRKHLL